MPRVLWYINCVCEHRLVNSETNVQHNFGIVTGVS
jgi:hypothetical protein